ncbi:hypothetical protein FRB95_013373 [Tulasnella sp. JGI-2019a]|nr:hypothetical protein FRB93_001054 [Tulasnella sp. JGI-2019a]KAG9034337.1 hypothetical protein FRB95_013373 [Tulasnella sp. JGI-2019a]
MVLEATMIIIDNSEYMRNGDYAPTRFGAQSDAVNVIFGRKTNANPENTVGLMTMAGKTPQVLATLTTDLGKILTGLHSTQISHEADLSTSLQVAQLALKHRQNKNQRQRIIAFVGSPLKPKAEEKAIVKLAKKLKKNNVAVDIVSFGEDEMEENEGLLRAFVESVQSGENSHLVSVPTGHHLLSDAIINSPIVAGEDGVPGGDYGGEASGSGGGGGQGQGFEFGVDPTLDPELAMALRMSLEEEQARQAATAPAAQGAATSTLAPVPEGATAPAAPVNLMDADDAEDEELAQAMLLSRQEGGTGGEAGDDEDEDVEMGGDDEDGEEDDDEEDEGGNLGDEEMNEEEAIAAAIAMSMNEDEEKEKAAGAKK